MQWNYSGCERVFSAHVPLLRTILGDLAFSHGYDVYLNDNTVHGKNTLSSSNLLRSRLIFTSLVPRDFYLLLFSFTTLKPLFSSTKLILQQVFYFTKVSCLSEEDLWKIQFQLSFIYTIYYNSVKLQKVYIYNTKKKKTEKTTKDIKIYGSTLRNVRVPHITSRWSKG